VRELSDGLFVEISRPDGRTGSSGAKASKKWKSGIAAAAQQLKCARPESIG
jgi:hypothetical protein